MSAVYTPVRLLTNYPENRTLKCGKISTGKIKATVASAFKKCISDKKMVFKTITNSADGMSGRRYYSDHFVAERKCLAICDRCISTVVAVIYAKKAEITVYARIRQTGGIPRSNDNLGIRKGSHPAVNGINMIKVTVCKQDVSYVR